MLYLHNKIESELTHHKTRRGLTSEGANGLKLLEISFDIKSQFEDEIKRYEILIYLHYKSEWQYEAFLKKI